MIIDNHNGLCKNYEMVSTKLAKEIEGESILNGIGSYTSCKLA